MQLAITANNRIMRQWLLILAGQAAAWALLAEENSLRGTKVWGSEEAANSPRAGVVVREAGRSFLRVTGTNSRPTQAQVLRWEHPSLDFKPYAITGEVRYAQVKGPGFLEMWSEFAATDPGKPPSRYFSRTLSDSGVMAALHQDSDWRPFMLPFQPAGAPGAPVALEFNVHLPGGGTVDIGPLSLVHLDSGTWAEGATEGQWWSASWTATMGSVLGGVLGCLGALLAYLASRGRARSPVLAAYAAVASLGVGLLTAGGIAALSHQPWHIVYFCLLTGVLISGIFGTGWWQMRRRYNELELRKMSAMDAGT